MSVYMSGILLYLFGRYFAKDRIS